jgi:hypothetical protein
VARNLNLFAEEITRPVTLPVFRLPPLDDIEDRKELAAKFNEQRIIRAGREAWEQIARTQSFRAWADVGKALLIGKARAQRIADDGQTWRECNYIYEFSKWMRDHGFGDMPKSVRSVAIELAENLSAIEAWRTTLPERQRKRLIHPLSNVRRWKAATTYNGKSPTDYKRDALFHWRRFLSCVQALPAAEQAMMWAMVNQERIADAA